MKVFDILRRSAASWPQHPALVDRLGAVSYSQLLAFSERVCDFILDHGVRPGQAVGVRADNGREFIIAAFGASAAGAVVVTLPGNKGREAGHIGGAEASCDWLLEDITSAVSGVDSVLRLEAGCVLNLSRGRRADSDVFAKHVPDAAFVRYTSGTTGLAKGVILSHADVYARIELVNGGLGLGSEDRVLWVMPMAIHFFVSIVLYLRYGVTILIPSALRSAILLEMANRHGATLLYASPDLIRLLALDGGAGRFETLRLAISTSMGLAACDAKAFQARYGIAVAQAYGIIEVGLPCCNLDASQQRPGSVGQVFEGYEVQLWDADHRTVAADCEGQLAIRGRGLFSGYLDPPRTLDEVLEHGGWFLTGDMGVFDAQGYLTIVGRCHSAIARQGVVVHPEQIEAVLNQHPAIEASRVWAEMCGKSSAEVFILCAELMLKEGAQVPDAEAMRKWCQSRLAQEQTPGSFEIVRQISMTVSGKIVRY